MRSAAFTFALLVVIAGFVPSAVATSPAGIGASADAGGSPLAQRSVSQTASPALEPKTTLVIRLQSDADARWTVRVRYRLATENQTRAFARLGRTFETGNATVGPNVTLFERAAKRASAVTDRGMRIENVSHTHRIDGDEGFLTLKFTWTNFARTADEGTLALGDAFRTPGNETWLTSLGSNQQLEIRTPPGYSIASNPGFPHRNDSIIVTGPYRFESDHQPILRYERLPGGNPGPDNLPTPVVVGGGAIVAALVLAALFVRRRTPSGAEIEVGEMDFDAQSDGDGTGVSTPETDDDPIGTEPPSTEATGAPDDGVDLSLLSDEERVERLLNQNGGRMKQATIVRETGWSDAKVSQLLSAMAEDGRVEKLRLGRENLISLPDDEE